MVCKDRVPLLDQTDKSALWVSVMEINIETRPGTKDPCAVLHMHADGGSHTHTPQHIVHFGLGGGVLRPANK